MPALVLVAGSIVQAAAATDKPCILVVWGDDIGQSNISNYTRGLTGYKTPDIDSIAEQVMVTSNTYGDWFLDRVYMLMPAQTYVANFLNTFAKFSPRQKRQVSALTM